MKRWAIAIALFVCWSNAASAVACRSSPGTDQYYQYRIIDGKRCWYPGREKLEKSALAWKSENPRAEAKQTLAPSTKAFASQASAVHVPNREFDSPDGGQRYFDDTFAHFPAYASARPVVHLLYPPRVSQAWGSKRVAVVVYRREP